MSIEIRDLGKLQTATEKVYPALEDLTITPTNSKQHFKSQDFYGYDNVTCNAVNLQNKQVNPTLQSQTITADNNYIGLSSVQIEGVSSDIDPNIKPENIKDGISILNTTGTYKGEKYKPQFIAFYLFTGTDLSYETENLDTSLITNMQRMFEQSSNLLSLDLSNWDTSNVTNMYHFCYRCLKLKSIDVSSFDTSKVTTMAGFFDSCGEITSLDLSSFDTRAVTNMENILNSVNKLTEIKFGVNWISYGTQTYTNKTTGTWTNTTTGVSYTGLQALLEAGRTLGAIEGTWVKS